MAYGISLEETGMLEQAQTQYQAVLSRQSTHQNALERLGFLYYRKLKNESRAKETFQKLLKVYPNHPDRKAIEDIINNIS
jgi:tetratricopeptide (TPR) repeat protein